MQLSSRKSFYNKSLGPQSRRPSSLEIRPTFQEKTKPRELKPLFDTKELERKAKLEQSLPMIGQENKPVVQRLYDELFEKIELLIAEDKQELDTSFVPKVLKARDRKMLKLVNEYGNLKTKLETPQQLYSTPSHGLDEIRAALKNFCELSDREMELPIRRLRLSQWCSQHLSRSLWLTSAKNRYI